MTDQVELPNQTLIIDTSIDTKEPHNQKISPPPELRDFLALFGGIAVLSLSATLTKYSEIELGANAITFNRLGIAFLGLILWQILQQLISSRSANFPPQTSSQLEIKDVLLLVIAGSCFGANLVTWAASFNLTSVAHAALLHFQNPIFTTLGAWLILGQSFDYKFLIGLILTISGGSILEIQDFGDTTSSFLGDGIALLSGVLFSAEILIIEQLRNKLSSVSISKWIAFTGALTTLPVALLTEDKLFPDSWNIWLAVIFLGFMCQFLGHTLFYQSLKTFSSAFATMAMMIIIVVSSILSWIIFAEPLTPLDGLAFVLVCVGIYIAKYGQGASKTNTHQLAVERKNNLE